MENADNVYTIPSEFGWSDLGTWASLHAESDKDEAGNVLQGAVMAYGVKDSLVRLPKGKLAVLGGMDGYIVVDEGDVLLVWYKSREQEIKKITGRLRRRVFVIGTLPLKVKPSLTNLVGQLNAGTKGAPELR